MDPLSRVIWKSEKNSQYYLTKDLTVRVIETEPVPSLHRREDSVEQVRAR